MEHSQTTPLVYGRLQNILFILCGGGWGISQGIQVSMGIILNELNNEWNLSFISEGLISTFSMIGIFLGFYFWGIIADKYGRMHAFQRTLLFVCIGSALTGFSPEMWTLSVSCLLTGFGIGGSYAVDGTVFLEYCPEDKQYLLTAVGLLSSIGAALPPGLAWIYSIYGVKPMWRVLVLSLAIVALLLLIPRFKIKETPAFIILQQERKVSENSKSGGEYINPQIANIQDTESIRSQSTSNTSQSSVMSVKEQLMVLFQRPLKVYTYLYIVIWSGTGFAFAGLSSFLPILLKRSGIDKSDTDIYNLMLYQQIAGLPGVIIAAYLVKGRLGRKYTLVLSLFAASFVLLGFLVVNYTIVLTFSVLYYFFQSMYLSVVYCISPETYPVEIRNTAVGVLGCANTLASIVAPIIAAVILNTTDDNFFFVLIFSVSLIVSAICSIWVLETRGFNPKSFSLIS